MIYSEFENLKDYENVAFSVFFLALTAASDSKCTSKGGRCQDCSQNKCTAGYEQYLCDGTKLELFFFFHLFTPKMLRHSEFQKIGDHYWNHYSKVALSRKW